MADEHPVHLAVAALTRQQRRRITVTDQVGYTVTAPCPLAQLVDALAVGQEQTGRRTVPGSRPPASTEALDLWREIEYNTHAWAQHLGIDRRAYRNGTASEASGGELPAVGRLLRAVAAEATTRGRVAVADAVHRAAVRWHHQIVTMLSGAQHQRPLRGVQCTACGAHTIRDQGDDAGRPCTVVTPAVVLTDDGDGDQWLVCQACGWSCALHTVAINRYCATIRTIAVRLWLLHPPRPLADYLATVRRLAVRLWLLRPPRTRQEVPA